MTPAQVFAIAHPADDPRQVLGPGYLTSVRTGRLLAKVILAVDR